MTEYGGDMREKAEQKKMVRVRIRGLGSRWYKLHVGLGVLCVQLMLFGGIGQVYGADLQRLQIDIVLGSKDGNLQGDGVAADFMGISKALKRTGYTSFRAHDRLSTKLALGSFTQVQLPGGEWLEIKVLSFDRRGRLRLEITQKKLDFRSVVAVKKGARVVVRGPAYEKALIIIVVRYARSAIPK